MPNFSVLNSWKAVEIKLTEWALKEKNWWTKRQKITRKSIRTINKSFKKKKKKRKETKYKVHTTFLYFSLPNVSFISGHLSKIFQKQKQTKIYLFTILEWTETVVFDFSLKLPKKIQRQVYRKYKNYQKCML